MAQHQANAAPAVGDADEAAIVQTVRDYLESWSEGDAARMERCLHPDLAKREVRLNDSPSRPWPPGDFLYETSALRQIQLTRHAPVLAQERVAAVTVLDRFENIASVKVRRAERVEYCHVARCNGSWVIINILCGLRQGGPGDVDDAAILRTSRAYPFEHSLHPALAKRTVGPILAPSPVWPSWSWPPGDKLYQLSALGLAQQFRSVPQPPADDPNPDTVTLLDRVTDGASVRVDSQDNVDYLHIAQWNGQWLIVNVLWDLRSEARPA